jgi:enamine deaminase RidA (YjgF/YER057c/UK114 family)
MLSMPRPRRPLSARTSTPCARAGCSSCPARHRSTPQTGAIVEGGIEPQTKQVFTNLEAVLTAAGVSFADVIKANVYLTDLADFPTVNAIYATIFT